jgi:hypothetical protein
MALFVAQSRLEQSACALEALHREWQDRYLSGRKTKDGGEFFTMEREGCVSRYLIRRTLRKWWDINSPSDLHQALEELFGGDEPGQFPAWDISRGLNRVIGYGLKCQYLTVEEAQPYWLEAVNLAKKCYGGWETYGRAVVEGRFHWSNDGQDHLFREALHQLLTHPASPWKRLEWEQLLA